MWLAFNSAISMSIPKTLVWIELYSVSNWIPLLLDWEIAEAVE
jgi:hypothetical protein